MRDGWDTYPRSIKRATLEWVKTAKTELTRAKRIANVAASLKDKMRPSPFRH
ncbi:MAG: YdeI/OmpD-associated family protein [Pseudomonadota bacterium]